MKTHITLTRKAASIKLESARAAKYFYQRGSGPVYEREVTVAEVVGRFQADDRARMRIRLADSVHTITVVTNRQERSGYQVEF